MGIRATVVAGSMLALLTVLTACAGGGTAAPATTPSTMVRPSTTVAASATKSVATASSFRAELTIQQAGLGLLTLTNTGPGPMTVQGWPTLRFLNAANDSLAVPVHKVPVPGAGPAITIKSGQTAFAGVKWATGDKSMTSTFVATSIRLTPPGASKSVNVDVIGTNGASGGYTEFDLTSVQVGTLQPVAQGVLVF